MDAADVFSEIYAQNQWGGGKKDNFTSGKGSRDVYTDRYCELINSFVQQHKVQTVVDLGCGDFRVGRRIARPEISYIGVDVVQDLIAYNERTFGADHIGFQCVDITSGVLPDGDLCLIPAGTSASFKQRYPFGLGEVRKVSICYRHRAPARRSKNKAQPGQTTRPGYPTLLELWSFPRSASFLSEN